DALEAEELPLEGRLAALRGLPHHPHRLDQLVEAPTPCGEVDPGRLELLAHPPDAEPRDEPPAGQPVDRREPLGEDERVVVRTDDDPGAEPDALRAARQVREQV